MPSYAATEMTSSGVGLSLNTNGDIMTLLVELLSNQHDFFAGVSTHWRNAWGDLSQVTQAITADTSVSQLQWSFDSGLIKRPTICMHIADHCGAEILQYAHSNGCRLPVRA